MVTRADVARAAGVSPAVVSYVLNDGPRPVSAAARERVERAIVELAYRPNKVAQALRGARTESIALLLPDQLNPHFAELAQAVEDAARDRGLALVIGTAGNDRAREADLLRSFLDRQVDGLLLIAASDAPDLGPLIGSGIPLVLLDRAAAGSPYSSVVIDNREAARLGVNHLLEHDRRRILYLSGPPGIESVRQRDQGWFDVAPDPGLLRRSEFSRTAGMRAVADFLTEGIGFDAVFAASDAQAIGALRALQEAGRSIGDEVCLVGVDGTEASQFTNPVLTSVVQDVSVLAQLAIGTLQAVGDGADPAHHIVHPTLRIGRSCGCDGSTATPAPRST